MTRQKMIEAASKQTNCINQEDVEGIVDRLIAGGVAVDPEPSPEVSPGRALANEVISHDSGGVFVTFDFLPFYYSVVSLDSGMAIHAVSELRAGFAAVFEEVRRRTLAEKRPERSLICPELAAEIIKVFDDSGCSPNVIKAVGRLLAQHKWWAARLEPGRPSRNWIAAGEALHKELDSVGEILTGMGADIIREFFAGMAKGYASTDSDSVGPTAPTDEKPKYTDWVNVGEELAQALGATSRSLDHTVAYGEGFGACKERVILYVKEFFKQKYLSATPVASAASDLGSIHLSLQDYISYHCDGRWGDPDIRETVFRVVGEFFVSRQCAPSPVIDAPSSTDFARIARNAVSFRPENNTVYFGSGDQSYISFPVGESCYAEDVAKAIKLRLEDILKSACKPSLAETDRTVPVDCETFAKEITKLDSDGIRISLPNGQSVNLPVRTFPGPAVRNVAIQESAMDAMDEADRRAAKFPVFSDCKRFAEEMVSRTSADESGIRVGIGGSTAGCLTFYLWDPRFAAFVEREMRVVLASAFTLVRRSALDDAAQIALSGGHTEVVASAILSLK